MKDIYLCQFNFLYGKDVFIPYSVGMLWAYALKDPEIRENYRNAGFVFIRKDPDEIVAEMVEPDAVAFSCYVWNWEMNVEVARRVKARFPKCLIIFGVPQVPSRMAGFFESYPFIDVVVHGEGEHTFVEVLRRRLRGGEEDIEGASVNRGPGTGVDWKPRARIKDINVIPSPYLEGLFDDLLSLPYAFQPIWETNRGCPYHCTYCDWGSLTFSKVSLFEMDRLNKEIDWFGDKKIDFVFGADANFGILERDLQLAKTLAEKKAATGGWPGKYRVSFAKNSTNRVVQIAEFLHSQKMDKGITLSVQSMDEDTLKTVKRTNLKIESLARFVREYQSKGIPTYTELILGLPGETYETFKAGVDQLLEAGVHDSLAIYNCTVLPNSELNAPEYREKHAIKTLRIPIFLNHSTPNEDPVPEYEEMVVATRTLPVADWRRQYIFAWAVQTFHTLNLTQAVSVCLNALTGLRYDAFYEAILDFARRHPRTVLGRELAAAEAKLDHVLSGGSWDSVLDEFSEITWSTDEAAYLRISKDLDGFYADLKPFLDELATKRRLELPEGFVSDMLRYQEAIVVKWEKDGGRELELSYPIHGFFRGCLVGDKVPLNRGRYAVSVRDPFHFNGDKRRFAKEVIWWGRKGGTFVYQKIVESPLNETRTAAIFS
jgi:putative methyltransferase